MIPLTYYNIFQYFLTYLLLYITTSDYAWSIFTRTMSMINAIQCVIGVLSIILFKTSGDYYDVTYIGDDRLIETLTWFYIYLLIDGSFMLLTLVSNVIEGKTKTASDIPSLLHHFVGGVGIYLISYQRLGLGIGIYFAFTEISTPLLNISWFLYTHNIKGKWVNYIFIMFYLVFIAFRILTIPSLIEYIKINHVKIHQLSLINYIMVYLGSGVLICLNLLWFLMLTAKLKRIK